MTVGITQGSLDMWNEYESETEGSGNIINRVEGSVRNMNVRGRFDQLKGE